MLESGRKSTTRLWDARRQAAAACLALAALGIFAGCAAEAKKDVVALPDTTLLTTGAAAVASRLDDTTEYPGLDYELTRERFDRWQAASQALVGVPVAPVAERLDVRTATDSDVDRVTDYLEDHAEARHAIEGAGMSPKDYVRTTLAVAQAAARERGVRFRQQPQGNVTIVAARRNEVERSRQAVGSRFLLDDAEPRRAPRDRPRRVRRGGDSDRRDSDRKDSDRDSR